MLYLTAHLSLLFSLSTLLTTSSAQDWIASELSQVNSYQYVRFTECTSFISTCQPTASTCASYICAECTGLGAKPLNSCCAGSDPVSCFKSLKGVAASASTTSAGLASASSVVVTTGIATTAAGTAAGTATGTAATVMTTGASATAASTGVTSTSATVATTAAANLAGGFVEAYSGHALGMFGVVVAVFAYAL